MVIKPSERVKLQLSVGVEPLKQECTEATEKKHTNFNSKKIFMGSFGLKSVALIAM